MSEPTRPDEVQEAMKWADAMQHPSPYPENPGIPDFAYYAIKGIVEEWQSAVAVHSAAFSAYILELETTLSVRDTYIDDRDAEIVALKAEIDKTYKTWVGRDHMHLPLHEAVGRVCESTPEREGERG